MKLNIWIVLLGLFFASCSDFLEESSQDEIRPSTVDDMDELLMGEAYTELFHDYITDVTYHFTDDVVCNGYFRYVPNSLFYLEYYQWKFKWSRDMFDEQGGGNDRHFWEMPYEKIKGCNVVLEYLDKVSGDKKKRESLRGEAYALRGFYYLTLVNYFGWPYNEGNPEKNLGVPLKLNMGVTAELPKRNMVADVYSSIERDLKEGSRLMEENNVPKSYDRMSYLGAKVLLSRMYLYMENWDQVIDYASQGLAIKSALLSLASLPGFDEAGASGVYGEDTPDEIIWARMNDNETSQWPDGKPPYTLSPELVSLYEVGENDDDRKDLRASLYITIDFDYMAYDYFSSFVNKGGKYHPSGIRTAEMYLNRAEAYIHKFMETKKDEFRVKALEDINYLRKHRYDTRNVAYQNIDIQDAQELFAFYKDERRRELCGEGNHRWFDLRRWGMPELKHVYFVKAGEEQTYMLGEKSSGYVLPIPAKAIEYNPNLEQNQ